MTTITLESIKAEHAKIGDLIAAFEKQQETAALFFPEVTINLAPGEHYAGHQINANDIKYVRADTSALEAIVKKAGEVMREKAAQMLLNGNFLHDQAPGAILAREAAKAIRALTAVTLEDLK